MTSRLRTATGASLTAAAVFSSRTPAALATLVDKLLTIPISPIQSPTSPTCDFSGSAKTCNNYNPCPSAKCAEGAKTFKEDVAAKAGNSSSKRRPGGLARAQAKELLNMEWMPPARGSESPIALTVQAVPLFLVSCCLYDKTRCSDNFVIACIKFA